MIGATKDLCSCLILQLPRFFAEFTLSKPWGFPDFWGPIDPIGVPKSDFASRRMTAWRAGA